MNVDRYKWSLTRRKLTVSRDTAAGELSVVLNFKRPMLGEKKRSWEASASKILNRRADLLLSEDDDD